MKDNFSVTSLVTPGRVILAAVLGTAGYFLRPVLHTTLLYLYRNPALIEAVVVTAVAGLAIFSRVRDKDIRELEPQDFSKYFSIISLVFVVMFGAALSLNTAYMKADMASQVMENSEDISSLPQADADNPRILPKSVAMQYASNSLQTPRYRLGSADIAVTDSGAMKWSMSKVPDRTINRFVLKQEGASFVDMSTQSKNVSFIDDKMEYGEGMQVFDNLYWQLKKERFWVEYQDAVNIPHEGENYLAAPMIGYDFHFRFPLFYTTPEYEGVALVDSSGEIEMLSPEEAAEHPVLEDQRIFPYDLARFKVSSMAYREGIINKWFIHEDQLEIGDLPGYGNEQPFTVMTEEGIELFTSTEPFGDAQGLFEVWLMDGQTGEMERYALNRSQGLLGAQKATNYVRKSNSRVNWDRFRPSEPLPVVVEDTLYWQIRVVSGDSSGIAFTSFVNAASGDVVNVQKDSGIREFLAGEEPLPAGNTTEEGRERDSVAELVVMEDGNVSERIPIYENETVEIRKR